MEEELVEEFLLSANPDMGPLLDAGQSWLSPKIKEIHTHIEQGYKVQIQIKMIFS